MFVRRRRRHDAREPDNAELAALADGTLPPEQRVALEARIADSPELGALLAEQERALELIRDAGAQVTAPADVRAEVAARGSGSLLRRLARGFAGRPRD